MLVSDGCNVSEEPMTKSTYTELWVEDKYSIIDTHQGLCLEMYAVCVYKYSTYMFCYICSYKQQQHIYTLHIQYVCMYIVCFYISACINRLINFPFCQEIDFKSVWGSYSMASGAESLWYHSGGAQIIRFETEIQGMNVGKFWGCNLFSGRSNVYIYICVLVNFIWCKIWFT